jgi:sugar lactone lactonase YvrE
MVSTLAGKAGACGSTDASGAAARFLLPIGITVDSSGNVYLTDYYAIRRITPAGVVSTFTGSVEAIGYSDGVGAAAGFNSPSGIATDSAGNVYVADTWNYTIRKIDSGGAVLTLAGGAKSVMSCPSADGIGLAASFCRPLGVATDSSGNIYVADTDNDTVRKITPDGMVSTFAGAPGQPGSSDGAGTAARFSAPEAIATDHLGNVYVADSANCTVRKITPAATVSTLAGMAGVCGSIDATGAAVRFSLPIGIATDSLGNVYVSDADAVRKITQVGAVSTLAGMSGVSGNADGVGASARFNDPRGIAIDSANNLYVADRGNSTIRKITQAGVVTTVVGVPGQAGFAPGELPGLLGLPTGVAINGTSLYVTLYNGVAVVQALL